jgi:formylglycine-generating enzyme required for sulfatase activity
VAWFSSSANGQTHSVAGKRPNAWGLYDMYGNVWNFCQDWYDNAYYRNAPTDDPGGPAGPAGGSGRVARGGGWRNAAWEFRSARRVDALPTSRKDNPGFRVALIPADK